MPDETKLASIRADIDKLVGDYLAEYAPDLIPVSWLLVFGATAVDYTDGREHTGMIHPNVPYSTRAGLAAIAVHDLHHGA